MNPALPRRSLSRLAGICDYVPLEEVLYREAGCRLNAFEHSATIKSAPGSRRGSTDLFRKQEGFACAESWLPLDGKPSAMADG